MGGFEPEWVDLLVREKTSSETLDCCDDPLWNDARPHRSLSQPHQPRRLSVVAERASSLLRDFLSLGNNIDDDSQNN